MPMTTLSHYRDWVSKQTGLLLARKIKQESPVLPDNETPGQASIRVEAWLIGLLLALPLGMGAWNLFLWLMN